MPLSQYITHRDKSAGVLNILINFYQEFNFENGYYESYSADKIK